MSQLDEVDYVYRIILSCYYISIADIWTSEGCMLKMSCIWYTMDYVAVSDTTRLLGRKYYYYTDYIWVVVLNDVLFLIKLKTLYMQFKNKK